MSARRRPDGPTLFDLPLTQEPPEERTVRPSAAAAPESPVTVDQGEVDTEPLRADFGLRLQAGLADLAFIALVAAGVVVGLGLAGFTLGPTTLAGIGLFVLDFSFLYLLLPLAFWGRTPGMAWAGVRVVALDGGLPTFRRCALRWLAAVLTVASAGLLVLVALLDRRSIADRLSASRLVLEDTR